MTGAARRLSPVRQDAVPFTSELRESETMREMTMARPDTVRGARARWLRRVVLLLPLALGACGYNSIQTLDETAAKSQKEIEVQLQRRADLIPNLVATVKGFAAQESSIFVAVAQAQRGLTGALARPGGANPAELATANDALSRAVLPMMTLVTSYPQLGSDTHRGEPHGLQQRGERVQQLYPQVSGGDDGEGAGKQAARVLRGHRCREARGTHGGLQRGTGGSAAGRGAHDAVRITR
jgi:hypothetical protein